MSILKYVHIIIIKHFNIICIINIKQNNKDADGTPLKILPKKQKVCQNYLFYVLIH